MSKQPQTTWRPRFTLDFKRMNSASFLTIVGQFEEWRKSISRPDLHFEDGWHTITPEIAEQILLLNLAGANRKPAVGNVFYYADQMTANDWQETGQPIIFNVHGDLLDGQHRLWAAYLSGTTFTTYIVNQRLEIVGGFAYIDNCRARSAKDALQTAGLDGLAGVVAMVINMSWHYDNDAYTPTTKHSVLRLAPKRILDYEKAHPNILKATRLMAGEYSSASSVIGHSDVAGFAAFKILDLYDETVLDDFMNDLGAEHPENAEDTPVILLQKLLEADRVKKEPMKKHMVLGHIILAFNMWISNSPLKKLKLGVADTYPKFMGPVQNKLAAE